jgi:superfamily I DNA/RNA helicase
MACEALRLTYSHLFMDEFQDTTQVQYDLVKAIFLGTDIVITAVGDNKQQIMRWAMAMNDPFGAFDVDFGAKRTPLHNNYRSSPELVRIQHQLARALDQNAVEPVSNAKATISGDACAIWDFPTPDIEAARLAAFIASEMKSHGLGPRDFVLLVRQRADRYTAVLEPQFRAAGIALRNEAGTVGDITLQELLPDEVSTLLVCVLRLAMTARAGRFWTDSQETIGALRGINPDDGPAQARFSATLDRFVTELRGQYPAPPTTPVAAETLTAEVVDFIGRDRLLAAHPAYAQGGWLEKIINAATLHLLASSRSAKYWADALDAYEGLQAVPLMTIHKSKGLEYHTVVFVGLDDDAWRRSFEEDRIEATSGFFVAFTRAKQRVVFTYCARRGTRRAIATLYQLLLDAGVKIIDVK